MIPGLRDVRFLHWYADMIRQGYAPTPEQETEYWAALDRSKAILCKLARIDKESLEYVRGEPFRER